MRIKRDYVGIKGNWKPASWDRRVIETWESRFYSTRNSTRKPIELETIENPQVYIKKSSYLANSLSTNSKYDGKWLNCSKATNENSKRLISLTYVVSRESVDAFANGSISALSETNEPAWKVCTDDPCQRCLSCRMHTVRVYRYTYIQAIEHISLTQIRGIRGGSYPGSIARGNGASGVRLNGAWIREDEGCLLTATFGRCSWVLENFSNAYGLTCSPSRMLKSREIWQPLGLDLSRHTYPLKP